jgi:hypothetical protein
MAGPIKLNIRGPRQSSAPSFTRFALGTRPPALRSPRIKPAIGVTQYAKQLGVPSAVSGPGDTGKTGET